MRIIGQDVQRLARQHVGFAVVTMIEEALRLGRGGRLRARMIESSAERKSAIVAKRSANFGQPTVFVDPRRAMVGVRVNLGR